METRRPPGLARRAPEKPRTVGAEDGPGHTHRLPRSLLLLLVIICIGLTASIVLVSLQAVAASHRAAETDKRLEALEDFIAERGEVRDEQYRTLDQRITDKICAVLDALPEGGIETDIAREANGCGPGTPLNEFPPAVQDGLRGNKPQPLKVDTDRTRSDYYAIPEGP
jgi:type II secretory pathway pseudopilin PulG